MKENKHNTLTVEIRLIQNYHSLGDKLNCKLKQTSFPIETFHGSWNVFNTSHKTIILSK